MKRGAWLHFGGKLFDVFEHPGVDQLAEFVDVDVFQFFKIIARENLAVANGRFRGQVEHMRTRIRAHRDFQAAVSARATRAGLKVIAKAGPAPTAIAEDRFVAKAGKKVGEPANAVFDVVGQSQPMLRMQAAEFFFGQLFGAGFGRGIRATAVAPFNRLSQSVVETHVVIVASHAAGGKRRRKNAEGRRQNTEIGDSQCAASTDRLHPFCILPSYFCLRMNRQPYQTPPRYWEPKMTPWIVKLWRPLINRELRRGQKITHIDVQGIEHAQAALRDNCGVMVTPNHSFHYDSYVMIETAHRVGQPFHFLSAWQVFAMSKPFEQQVLQWHGCFSINREAADLKAFKQAVDIVAKSPQPLVVFPEGDIYHSNDRVTPFRDGAAAIAMSAAKKSDRKVVCIPAALKCFYVKDPSAELAQVMTRLEERMNWRPRTDWPLDKRILNYADGLLAVKEIEHIGKQQSGTIPERIQGLANHVLAKHEQTYGVKSNGGIVPDRVKEVRRAVIKQLEVPEMKEEVRRPLVDAMDDLFFVVQLFSYPGNYLAEKPTIERTAETLDKFEEDVLQQDFPGIRGERHAVVRFGPPIEIPKERTARDAVQQLTEQLEKSVQGLLDEINAERK